MNIILLGPPGAGKGTLAFNIKEELGMAHLSSGDILRDEIKRGTQLGKKAEQYIAEGKLVPDEYIIDMILGKIDALGKGVILDGFPRTVVQAEKLAQAVKIDAVIELTASVEVVMDRICSRRVCSQCKAVYNVKSHPEETCDACGSKLIARDDDKPETVSKRYAVYLEQTQPLIDFYAERGLLHSVNGEADMNDISKEVLEYLREI